MTSSPTAESAEIAGVQLDPNARPVVRLAAAESGGGNSRGGGRRRNGNRPPQRPRPQQTAKPWVFANEVAMDAAAKALPPGQPVRLETAEGRPLGCYLFNRHALICARRIDADPAVSLDAAFFARRLARAAAIRERLIATPFHRLAHAEADGLPGTVIDRFGQVFVVQVNTAGMAALAGPLVAALESAFKPEVVVLRQDSPSRAMEGLETGGVEIVKGTLSGPVTLEENGARFLADLSEGQKTGWFYDQRDNRAFAAGLARGERVLDAYSFAGGFAIQAALAGAKEVVALDRSQPALDLAKESARLNGVEGRIRFEKTEVFAALAAKAAEKERFGLVILDPPAFVKSRKDYHQGMKGYRKMMRLGAPLVAEDGFVMACSCSHHAAPEAFAAEIAGGLSDSARQARLLRSAGAGVDHPVHPGLPETAYLKSLTYALD